MPLFLSDAERQTLAAGQRDPFVTDLLWALTRRASIRAAKPGLMSPQDTVDWWRVVAEYLTDAAMAHALKPAPHLAVWLRDVTLSITRRPVADWVGPEYRQHLPGGEDVQLGHLETAHLCWALAVVLDLAPEVLQPKERDEVEQVLRHRGMPMCLRWLENKTKLANWRLVLLAGLTVPAVVLDDRSMIERAIRELPMAMECFQPDGSYTESLQYGNYALLCATLSLEALRRRDEKWANLVPVSRYGGYARWAAYSHLYMKPLSGRYGIRPRAFNFNDSAAMFRPSAEVLLHIAARGKSTMPTEAGLARWLFETTYANQPAQGPFDQASFGLVNHFGVLTLPLYAQAAKPLTPAQADLPTMQAFSCGDVIVRDAWDGRTALGFHGGGDALHGPGHLHGDLNSFILVHNQERLLADPGHCCYRNLIHEFDVATSSHNTCTFRYRRESLTAPPSGSHGTDHLAQRIDFDRHLSNGQPTAPLDRGGRLLLAAQHGPVYAIVSEVARAYGHPLTSFTRICLLCGPHVLFVIDRIESQIPVTTTWHWLLNNRDDQLDLKWIGDDRLVARRGNAGMKLFNLSGSRRESIRYAYLHDAYHCLPNHPGEGRPGSGVLVRWSEKQARAQRQALHAMIMDGYGSVADWHLQQEDVHTTVVTGWKGSPCWRLKLDPDSPTIQIKESQSQLRLTVQADAAGPWHWSAR